MAWIIEERDLNFSGFHCCGDEDLYPFGCPRCRHLMVFCYECDTLYSDLDDLSRHGREQVNSFDENRPSFACPRCGYEFEYYFMRNPLYWVPRSEWLAAGYAHLLETAEDAAKPFRSE